MKRVLLAAALVIVFANMSHAGSKSWRKPQMEECASWTFSFSWSSSKHGKDYEDCDEDPVPASTSENEDCEREWSWKDFCGKSLKWLLYKKLRERCDDYDWKENCDEYQREEECEEYDNTYEDCDEDQQEEECEEYDSTPQECEEDTWEEECEEYEEEECLDTTGAARQERCEEYQEEEECEDDNPSAPTGLVDAIRARLSSNGEEETDEPPTTGIEASGSIELLLTTETASEYSTEQPAPATVDASTPVEESPLAAAAAVEAAEVAALVAPAETVAAVVESVAVVADEPEVPTIVEIVLADVQTEPVAATFTAEPVVTAVAAPVVVAEIVPVTIVPVIAAVPEPSALLLALVGLGGAVARRRR